MLNKINLLRNAFETARDKNLAKEFVEQNKSFVLDLNRKQLRSGVRSDDTEVTPYYANLQYKGRRAPVDLLLTGAFYGSFKIKIGDTGFEIFATDAKDMKLRNKYGQEILGLGSSSIYELKVEIEKDSLKELKRLISYALT